MRTSVRYVQGPRRVRYWKSSALGPRTRGSSRRAVPSDGNDLVGFGPVAPPTQSLQILLRRQPTLGDRDNVIHFEKEMRFRRKRHRAVPACVMVARLD